MHTFIQQLKQKLTQPLPGLEAQLKMTSRSFRSERAPQMSLRNVKEDAKKAGVCLLLFQKDEKWYTALMQRPESPYAHSRQVSFPGGGYEESDPNFEYTATRETEEEFGIPRENITILGTMTPLYIPVSNYLVYPHIGYIEQAPTYSPDPAEVDEIIEVPVEDLLNPNLRKKKDIKTANGFSLKNVPYFNLANKVVWGATAMMLSEFVTILESDNL